MNSNTFLKRSVQIWFIISAIGIWIFAYYVLAFYLKSGFNGEWVKWNEVLPHGYIQGDVLNNILMASHVFIAFIVLVGGPLQFLGSVRKRFPKFHRYNGRIYLISGVLISLGGLFIIIYKGSNGGVIGNISLSINTILVLVSAFFTLKSAINKDFNNHQKWAIRLFLVLNGVWFFRIGLMFWLFIFQGRPVGFDLETFQGPFITLLGFSQYSIPLLVAELYFIIKTRGSKKHKIVFSALMMLLATMTAIGVFAASISMWLPRI